MKARRESSENIRCDPLNQNSDQSDQEKWSTSKSGPVFSKLFRLDWTDPLSLGLKFPEILVQWITPIINSLPSPSPPPPPHLSFSVSTSVQHKYMNGSTEWIKEHLFQFGSAQQFFTPSPARNFDCGATLERFLFRGRTFLAPNLMHKL